ncbi:MAG: hypothetical protein ACFFDI_11380 [Promethearchaeota archaeon]
MLETTSDLMDLKPPLSEIIGEYESLAEQLTLQTFCCTLESKKELHSIIGELALSQDEKDRLFEILEESTTSFSWGTDDFEFVILIFDNPKEAREVSKLALEGLFLHEMFHSVQRQRGLEDDLHRSMRFSLDFFTQLAEFIPEGHFPKEEIISFLKSISQFAVLALKDLYVNTELIRRGKSLQLLEYDEILLGLQPGVKATIKAPEFHIPYEKGKIVLKSLDELEEAINYTISLIPSYFPFSKLNRVKNEALYERAQRIRKHIEEAYYSNLPEFMYEFLILEDLYLTTFAFNEAFHRKFFGAFFNNVLELILGENFLFYHMSKISELLDTIYEEDSKKTEVLVPLLKAAYHLFLTSGHPGIQKENCDLLQGLIMKTVPEEELNEFKEFMATEPDADVANLLELSFFILLRDLRYQLFDGRDRLLLTTCRALLLLLHVTNHLNPTRKEYAELKNQIYKIINHKRRLFYRVLFTGKAEVFAKLTFFDQTDILTPSEFEEFMYNMQFFGIVVNNEIFNFALALSQLIKMTIKKYSPDDPNFPTTTALICISMAASTITDPAIQEDVLSILRAILLALGCNFKTVRAVAIQFAEFSSIQLPEDSDEASS